MIEAMNWWQILVIIALNSILILSSVFIGGYLVFRTKHAQLQIPFVQAPIFRKEDDSVGSYNSDFEDEMDDLDDGEVSPDVRRMFDQGRPESIFGKVGG